MLNIQNISKSFGGVMALHEVSFRIEEGSFVGLIGPNGSGKTTMFNVISGALKPTLGEVNYEGKTISGLTPTLSAMRASPAPSRFRSPSKASPWPKT